MEGTMATMQKQAFKPGDIVWVKDNDGEFAGIVLEADDHFIKVEAKESEFSTAILTPGYPPSKVRHAKGSDFKGKPAWLQNWYKKNDSGLRIIDMTCTEIKTTSQQAKKKAKKEAPLTLAEIKEEVTPIVKSHNHCVSARFKIDKKRHAIILTVRNDNLVDAKSFAEYLEGVIEQNFNQKVPVDVVMPKPPKEYTVTSTGKTVHIYRGETAPDPIKKHQWINALDNDGWPVCVPVDDDDWF